jgi:hypothetical protein
LSLSEVEKQTLRGLFPSRNTFTFESGIQISSDFDSGNLSKCNEVEASSSWAGDKKSKTFNFVNEDLETYFTYEMWLCPDGWPYLPDATSGRAGFFFDITGLPVAAKKFDEEF